MSRHERRDIIDRGHCELSVVRQCELLDISRSSVYYNPVEASEYELGLMGLINCSLTGPDSCPKDWVHLTCRDD